MADKMKDQEESKSEIIVNSGALGLVATMWLAADQLGVDSVYSEDLNRTVLESTRLECRRWLASQGSLPFFGRESKPCNARIWSASW